jgi:nucleoside-diphosphate-sugar epimerase
MVQPQLRHRNNGHSNGIAHDNSGSVLITGAAGFGGSYLARALLALGYRVTGLDITSPPHAALLANELEHPNFSYLWGSLQDIQPEDVEGHSVVVHLAAQADAPLAFGSPRYTLMQNIDGTVALLEAVRHAGGVERLLFAGSGNEIGRPLQLPIDEDHPLTPHNPYGFSKAAAELAGWTWHRAYGVPAVVMSTGVDRAADAPRGLHLQVVVECAARHSHCRGRR